MNFSIDASTRVITVAAETTLTVGQSYEVTVTANDGTANSSDMLTITIDVTSGTGGTNTAPTFGSTLTQTITTANTVVGETVGTATAATDAESDTLTYTLGGTDAGRFAISNERVITVATALTAGSYEVTVTANDGTENSSDMLTITITVTGSTVSGRVAIGAVIEDAMVTALCGTTATAAETNSDGVYNIPLDDLDNDDCDDVVRVQAEFNVNGVSRTLYSLSTVAEDSDGDIVANVTPQSDVLLRGALAKVFDEGTLGNIVESSSDLFEAGFELENIPDTSAESLGVEFDKSKAAFIAILEQVVEQAGDGTTADIFNDDYDKQSDDIVETYRFSVALEGDDLSIDLGVYNAAGTSSDSLDFGTSFFDAFYSDSYDTIEDFDIDFDDLDFGGGTSAAIGFNADFYTAADSALDALDSSRYYPSDER